MKKQTYAHTTCPALGVLCASGHREGQRRLRCVRTPRKSNMHKRDAAAFHGSKRGGEEEGLLRSCDTRTSEGCLLLLGGIPGKEGAKQAVTSG